MKTQFVELPISTRDGKFIAQYSEKGLAEIDWPKVGRASSRVLAANKKLGGFSGGLDWKRKLLARENIKI